MGNRGCLHNDKEQLVSPYCGVKRWIICVLEFKGKKLPLMKPGIYTPLFFLDEATALAAGHRPCALCRKPRFKEFKNKWLAGNPGHGFDSKCSIDRIDAELHKDRWLDEGGQRTYPSRLTDLPDGVIVSVPGEDAPYLWWNQALYLWSPQGYHATKRRLPDDAVVVHTPLSTVKALRAGFVPMIHPGVRSERD
jgi:hypothetical protein